MKTTRTIPIWFNFDSMRGMATPRWAGSRGPITALHGDIRLIGIVDIYILTIEEHLNERFR